MGEYPQIQCISEHKYRARHTKGDTEQSNDDDGLLLIEVVQYAERDATEKRHHPKNRHERVHQLPALVNKSVVTIAQVQQPRNQAIGRTERMNSSRVIFAAQEPTRGTGAMA